MALTYSNIKRSEGVLVSMTGLNLEQFARLEPAFEHQYEKRYGKYTLEGTLRKRARAKKQNDKLPGIEDKMLFILTYVKTYPIQQVQACMFDMTQPQGNSWIHRLLPILNDALNEMGLLPERNSTRVKRKVESEHAVILDGTERPIHRPKDVDVRKQYYSGKKNGIR